MEILYLICAHIIIGSVVLMFLTKRISRGEVYAEIKFNPFLGIILWPWTLWFYTRKEIVERITRSRHDTHPWAYDIEDNEYPKEVQDKLLKQQIKEKLGIED